MFLQKTIKINPDDSIVLKTCPEKEKFVMGIDLANPNEADVTITTKNTIHKDGSMTQEVLPETKRSL